MRLGEVVLEYTCESDVIHVSRLGTTQLFAIKPNRMAPPELVEDSDRKLSYRGRRKATTVHGSWYEGTIVAPRVSGDRQPLLTEFLQSVSAERIFTVKADHIPGVMRTFDAFIPLSRYPQNRDGNTDQYKLSLQYRTIGESWGEPVSTAASILAVGIADTQSYGHGPVDVSVLRFCYFMFEGSIVNQTITFNLDSIHDIGLSINGRFLGRHTGSGGVVTVKVSSELQMTGTNSLRFESLNLTDDWSVSNVMIT